MTGPIPNRPVAITVRFDAARHADLTLIARVRGVPITQVVRAAIDSVIEQALTDPAFRTRLEQLQAEERAYYDERRSTASHDAGASSAR